MSVCLSVLHRHILQACLTHRTTADKTLASVLFRSPRTIHSDFEEISRILHTHSRFESILVALENGWIFLPDSPVKNTDNRRLTPRRRKVHTSVTAARKRSKPRPMKSGGGGGGDADAPGRP